MLVIEIRVKGLLIDFDGVIVDSTKAYIKATKVTRKSFSFLKTIENDVGETSLEIARRLDLGFSKKNLVNGIDSESPEKIIDFVNVWLRAWNEACLWEVKPFSGVYDVLTVLSKRYPLALITLRHIENSLIQDQLKRLKLNEFFKTIITALDVRKPKPEPDSFLEGARRLEVSIGDCAVVGDSILDIRAGKSAGAQTIAVLSGIFDKNALEQEEPDLILNNIVEILPHLK